MSLGLNPKDEKGRAESAYSNSQTFIDAVNDAQFVRSFGMAALVGSILGFLFNGALTIGIGLAVMGFGSTLYYRLLGLLVVILAASTFLVGPLGLLGQMTLSVGIGV